MLALKGVEAIVFDLGGVIIDLDFQRSFEQFSVLSGQSQEDIKKGLLESGVLQRYEKGQYSDSEFIEEVARMFHLNCSQAEIEEAFLALLLNIPPARIELLKDLSKQYRLFLLSNTSSIHYQEVNRILYKSTGHRHLNELFEKVFLSFELGLLKPSIEIYKTVLKTTHLKPEHTLFLDDNADNLKGASTVGIRTSLVSAEQSILTLFNYE
jgi:epoxide hydrolase-like predicted phosphatase